MHPVKHRRPAVFRRLTSALFVAFACAALPGISHADDEGWTLFGTSEVSFDDISAFKKWTNVLERYPVQKAEQEALCKQAGRKSACVLASWMQQLDGFRSLSREKQIEAVNTQMNAMPYIEDIVNWGMEDYWVTPIEFLQRSGDCEDYAIAKYKSLRILGFEPDELRIVVLNDLNLSVLHAVLAVHTDGQFLILDNQIKQTIESKRVFHYQPIYSINENGWWRHQPKAYR